MTLPHWLTPWRPKPRPYPTIEERLVTIDCRLVAQSQAIIDLARLLDERTPEGEARLRRIYELHGRLSAEKQNADTLRRAATIKPRPKKHR